MATKFIQVLEANKFLLADVATGSGAGFTGVPEVYTEDELRQELLQANRPDMVETMIADAKRLGSMLSII
jgi:hypothetical protein